MSSGPFWLDPRPGRYGFPDPDLALDEPNGLLAVGGDLSPQRLLAAYRLGIFPWYSDDQPLLWWTPNPRAVLFPDELHLSRSLRKTLRKEPYRITFDQAFPEVVEACSGPRTGEPGTWITEEMKLAYRRLHELGYAHSAEAWDGDGTLAGGLYGVSLGGIFFGESMFARRPDASKVAFVHLVNQLQAWGFGLIDCQMASAHLARFGAREVPRDEFNALLEDLLTLPDRRGPWQPDPETREAT